MSIYTRGGDGGETSLLGGSRVLKNDPRLVACGALDELNSALGILRLHVSEPLVLERIQADLFALGARIAASPADLKGLESRLGTPLWPLEEIEADIDRLMQLAPPLRCFILPGGSPGSAWAHWARTVCRRAEREIVAVSRNESIDPRVLSYINRLSDWLFALARAENARGGQNDLEWKP